VIALVAEDPFARHARDSEELSERRLFAAAVHANGGMMFVPFSAMQLAADDRIEFAYHAVEGGVLISARPRP
jgi:hypothetical protein